MNIENREFSPEPLLSRDELLRYPEPDIIVPGMALADFRILHSELGVNYAIVDLDNTIADALPNDRGEYDYDAKFVQALMQARDEGFLKEYFLLSNIQVPLPYLVRRVEYFARLIDTRYYYAAVWPNTKPNPIVVNLALEAMEASSGETVMIGDQLSKDVRAARNAGCWAALRYPHYGRDPKFRQKKRRNEREIIARYIAGRG